MQRTGGIAKGLSLTMARPYDYKTIARLRLMLPPVAKAGRLVRSGVVRRYLSFFMLLRAHYTPPYPYFWLLAFLVPFWAAWSSGRTGMGAPRTCMGTA
jgi:hypothetical protein